MSVTIPAVPQVGNCVFYTASKVIVMGNISLSCLPVTLNFLEVRDVEWRPYYITTSILDCILHLAAKDFGLVALQTKNGDDLEFFG